MDKQNISMRQKAISSAIGSVRAEGLSPSLKTQKRLNDYADGIITAQELKRITVQEMRVVSTNRLTTIVG